MKRLLAAGCLLFGFAGTSPHAAEDVSQGDRMRSCREEVWRVYAPSNGPKSNWLPRSQKRTVLVCSQRVFAQGADQVSGNSRQGEDR